MLLVYLGCSDFLQPVESTSTPSEYEFNYWLLQKTYLFEEELQNLSPEGDSVQNLYKALNDPFTRYVAPSKSESASISLNTSIIQGDVGMEYYISTGDHPLFVYRIYPESPAGRAGVPRYGNILQANGIDISGKNAYSIYDSIVNHSREVEITIAYKEDTTYYDLVKEDVYAPTVFLDTLFEIEFIQIKEFKPTTSDKENGTYGELKKLLDGISDKKKPRILDLRSNPGGHVNQCISMADLFVKKGPLSTRNWRSLEADGKSVKKTLTINATAGDSGEDLPLVLLVNKNSASCAEIFTAAVSEGANVPVVGSTTYGKGIGQSTWITKDKGLAIITNLEFLTPKGNSYHKKGIVPDYACDTIPVAKCAISVIEKNFAKKAMALQFDHILDAQIMTRRKGEGGAILFNP